MAQTWIDCLVAPGQFTGEFAVQVEARLHDQPKQVSLFATSDEVTLCEALRSDHLVQARLRVEVAGQKDDLLLIKLPRNTLENGRFITVRTEAIHEQACQRCGKRSKQP